MKIVISHMIYFRLFWVLWFVCVWHLIDCKHAGYPSLKVFAYSIHGEFRTKKITAYLHFFIDYF